MDENAAQPPNSSRQRVDARHDPAPSNGQLPDRVAADALCRIDALHSRRLRHVTCEHCDGVLTLGGQVPTFHLKQVAQECVKGVPGIARIVNDIEVVARNGTKRS